MPSDFFHLAEIPAAYLVSAYMHPNGQSAQRNLTRGDLQACVRDTPVFLLQTGQLFAQHIGDRIEQVQRCPRPVLPAEASPEQRRHARRNWFKLSSAQPLVDDDPKFGPGGFVPKRKLEFCRAVFFTLDDSVSGRIGFMDE